MSCQLNLLSSMQDCNAIRRFLYPSWTEESEESGEADGDEWNNQDWGWGEGTDTDTPVADESETTQIDEWMSECQVSISPLGELIVLAKDDRLAVLQISYEEKDDGMFVVLWKGVVSEFPREMVTCVYCLPLISHKQSSQGAPEWTCVIVGFNTGHVRMYDETGTKVLDQMIHNESVMSIKCKTYSPPRYPASSDLSEELTILYETVLVTLDGFGLFQTLRACKNQAAMAAASGSRALELPPLGYKKWGLKDQGSASDHISAGSYTPNPFDQMQAASLAGFGERVSSVPPTTNVYSCTGDNPFLGVYHAIEGESYHLLSNVTGAASKLLSVGAAKLLSWGSSFLSKQPAQPEPEKKQQRIEPANPVYQRFSIYDKRRIGQSMALSPYGNVAAVTDTLGRVLLVDTSRGTIKRMWKGYRNAQVGWMTVKEPSSSRRSTQRHALFLVIYAPKRGLLEIWLSEGGPRVGAFNVGKGCRLIYPGCSLLGLNSSTYRLVKGKTIQCFLLKRGGEMMDIIIPFHLALSDANSKRAHDQQLMKLVKAELREKSPNSEEIWKSVSKMKLTASLNTALEKVLTTEHMNCETSLAFSSKLIQHIRKSTKPQGKEIDDSESSESGQSTDKNLDVESRVLVEYCQTSAGLIEIYDKLHTLHQNQTQGDKIVDLSSVLPVDEVSSLLMMRVPGPVSRRVAFTAEGQLISLPDFLSLWERQHQDLLRLKRRLTDSQINQLGQLLFEPCLKRVVSLEEVLQITESLKLRPRILLDMLLGYYLSSNCPPDGNLPVLQSIIATLHELDDKSPPETELPSTPEAEGNLSAVSTPATSPVLQFQQDKAPVPVPQTCESPWWEYINDKCETSSCLRGYLHVALASRSICLKQILSPSIEVKDQFEEDFSKPLPIKKDNSKDDEAEQETDQATAEKVTASEDWEHMSVEVAMWNLSLKHLEDIVTLNTLLQFSCKDGEGNKTKTMSSQIVTVREVKIGNKGLIGELVGRWCVQNKLDPADLKRYENTANEGSHSDDLDAYGLLQQAFPLSLSSDIAYANACWEYASHWNKDVENLGRLKTSLLYARHVENGCLRHGLCIMIWRIYLFKRVSSLVTLMEKVGKAPKDRLCKKEIDMDTATATEFMNIVCDYMEIFMQANCDFGEAELYKQECSWAEEITGHSLVEMASQQKETNYRLLKHHNHLFIVVTAVLTFSIKSVKIMTLFDNNGAAAFFKELDSHPYLGHEGKNEVVSFNRKEFLCRILRHAVQSLPERETMIESGGSVKIDKECDGRRWPAIVISLAEAFELDTDELRKFFAARLVSHGYDLLALEVLPLMDQSMAAHVEILELCAQRFVYLMFKSDGDKTAAITGAASPSLLEWLSHKDYSGLSYLAVPIADTNRLLLNLLKGLKVNAESHKYAEELYSLTSNLTD